MALRGHIRQSCSPHFPRKAWNGSILIPHFPRNLTPHFPRNLIPDFLSKTWNGCILIPHFPRNSWNGSSLIPHFSRNLIPHFPRNLIPHFLRKIWNGSIVIPHFPRKTGNSHILIPATWAWEEPEGILTRKKGQGIVFSGSEHDRKNSRWRNLWNSVTDTFLADSSTIICIRMEPAHRFEIFQGFIRKSRIKIFQWGFNWHLDLSHPDQSKNNLGTKTPILGTCFGLGIFQYSWNLE